MPTLCQTAGDCVSSIGSDPTLTLRARKVLPRLGPTSPRLDFGVGYEWLTTKLVGSGAVSTRSCNGPLFAVLELEASFRLGSRWTIGPTLGAMIGVFANEGLDADVAHRSASVPDRTAHGRTFLGLRVGFEP